jgi:phosphonopyruvate decarboxylase
MGLASSVGLGLSLASRRRLMVIDGDGAALMHLGALPMIGRYGGHGFLHVVLDNGTYDSTGGQASLSGHAPFAEIAARCGYAYAACVDDATGLADALAASASGPALLHVRIRPGSPRRLPRPSVAPPGVLRRLQDHFDIAA